MKKKKQLFWNNDISQEMIDSQMQYYIDEGRSYSEEQAMDDISEFVQDELSCIIRFCENTSTDNKVIAIADLGLWSGRCIGYNLGGCDLSVITDFSNDIIDIEYYVEDGNFKSSMSHHDGTNHIIYREFKSNISEEGIDHFCNLLYNGKAKKHHINYYTKSVEHYFRNAEIF